ncbi:MAG: DUF2330 domain-containing protein [Gemmataceae bacterium]
MKFLAIRPLVILLLALFLLPSFHTRLGACVVVMKPGSRVGIDAESALIVWDQKAKKQHFIRRASFRTADAYFGFLVPTPNRPDLSEVSDEVFRELEEWTKPETRQETQERKVSIFSGGCLPQSASPGDRSSMTNRDSVEVLDRVRVAGLNAVVLRATDPDELEKWLKAHGYEFRLTLRTWLEPYIREGWYLTAFQLAKPEGGDEGLSTKAVQLSFSTEKPFYPYSEPMDAPDSHVEIPPRLLRVFFLGAGQVDGGFSEQRNRWAGKAVWSGPLHGSLGDQVKGLLGTTGKSLSEKPWLTVFDDASSPRSSFGDVFFTPSADSTVIRRPPIINYKIVQRLDPLDYPLMAILLAALISLPVYLYWRLNQPAPPRYIPIDVDE